MWKAAIVGLNEQRAGQVRACLEQTGLVGLVTEWRQARIQENSANRQIPDVVVLGLEENIDATLAFAAELRKAHPAVRILACSQETAPDSRVLLAAMRSGIQEILASPLTATVMQEALLRFHDQRGGADSAPREKLILVMGSKGGVGTSTVAVNLAIQLLSVTERRVALVDLARPVGHQSLLLDVTPRFGIRDAADNIERLDSHFLSGLITAHKSGVELLAGVAQMEDWNRISPAALAGIINVLLSGHEYVVLDFGTVYSKEWLVPLASHPALTVLVVAEPNVPSLWTLEKHVHSLAALLDGRERIRVIINRWQRGDENALQGLEKKIQCEIFARLPNDFPQVSESVNLGTPLSRNHNDPLVTRFRTLAAEVAGPGAQTAKPSKARGAFYFFKAK